MTYDQEAEQVFRFLPYERNEMEWINFAKVHIRGLMKIARLAKTLADNATSQKARRDAAQTATNCVTCARRWHWRMLERKRNGSQ